MGENEVNPERKTNKIFILLVLGVLFVFSSYASFLIYITWPIEKLTINNAGVFGDSFGLLTAVFSGLAFTGLIWTILLQRDELQLQRIELKLTRKEFERMSNTQSKQLDVMYKQYQIELLEKDFIPKLHFYSGGPRGRHFSNTSKGPCFIIGVKAEYPGKGYLPLEYSPKNVLQQGERLNVKIPEGFKGKIWFEFYDGTGACHYQTHDMSVKNRMSTMSSVTQIESELELKTYIPDE